MNNNEFISDEQVVEVVKSGNIAVLEKVILCGYNINQYFFMDEHRGIDEDGYEIEYEAYFYSLLSIACESENIEIVKILIKYGAKIYSETERESEWEDFCEVKNPIICACKNGNVDILNFLVDNGANLDIRDRNGNTLVDIAIYNNNIDILKYLVSKVKTVNLNLHAACNIGNTEIVKYLIEKGANINQRQFKTHGQTPIEAAGNNLEIIRLLLSLGAKPSLFGIKYETCYCDGVWFTTDIDTKEILPAIKLLIDSGADVNEERKNDMGNYSPLTLAIYGYDYNAVKYLVEKGANYNIRLTRLGDTGDIDGSSDYQSTLSLAKERLSQEYYNSDEKENYEVNQLKQIVDYLKSLGAKDYCIDSWCYDNFAEDSVNASMDNPFDLPYDTSIDAFFENI